MEDKENNSFSMDNLPEQTSSPSNDISVDHETFTNVRIFKNCAVLSIGVMLYLTSSLPCRELQGSINIEHGLGSKSQTVFSASSIISQLFLPTLVINLLGLKHSITISLLLESVFFFSNFYPSFYTMIPAALISGFTGAPIWTAKATYLTLLGDSWSKRSKIPVETTVSVLFGVFYAFYYFGYVWGNVASYFILREGLTNDTLVKNISGQCGMAFCDFKAEKSNPNFRRPPDFEIYTLFGTFILVSWIGAAIVALFLDPVPKETRKEKSSTEFVLMTVKALRDPKQWLPLPMSFFRGVMRTFVAMEFTKAFVTCSWGVHYVGLTMISFGILCGAASFSFGHLVRWTGRLPLFCLAAVIQIALSILLSEWTPNQETVSLFFVIPGLFGISNAVWESQVANIYGIAFPGQRDVSYSLYSFAEGLGSAISAAYSYNLCLSVKLIILSVFLFLAFASYLVTEIVIILKKPMLKIGNRIQRPSISR